MMGLSPRAIDAMTPAEFRAYAEGFRQFHCAEASAGPSADDYWTARMRAEERGQA